MRKLELDCKEVTPTQCLASPEICHLFFFKCLNRDSQCSYTFLSRSFFGIKTSHSACSSLGMQLAVLVLCGNFLLNMIPSCLDFLLGQAVIEHQDISEYSFYSPEIYLISMGCRSFIVLSGCH